MTMWTPPLTRAMRFAAATLLFTASISCRREAPSASPAPPSAAPATVAAATPARVAQAAPPISREELEAFGRAIAKAVSEKDKEGLAKLSDWNQLLEKILDDFGDSERGRQAKAGVRDGFKSIADKNPFVAMMTKLEKDDRFDYQKLVETDGGVCPLFRYISSETGVTYLRAVAARSGEGLRIVDCYNYSTGELLSQTMHRVILPMVVETNRGFLDRLTKEQSAWVKNSAKVSQMTNLIQGGQARDALAVYATLPEELKADKTVLLLRLQAASTISDAQKMAAIDDLRKHHPKDPSLALMAIDLYVHQKKHDEALACIDQLDAALFHDPYTLVLRAGVLADRQDYDAARAAAETAKKEEPGLTQAYWSLLTISLEAKRYDETVQRIGEIEKELHVVFSDLKDAEVYAGFVQSPQYRAWMNGRS